MYLTVNTEEARAGKIIPDPPWLTSLQTLFFFSLCLPKGLVVLTDRLTESRPEFFPWLYLGLLLTFFTPWMLWKPQKDKRLSWRQISLLIFYLIPLTFIVALGIEKNDPILSSRLWLIPLGIVGLLLLIAALIKKSYRRQATTAGLWLTGFVVWIAVVFWIGKWIS